MLIRLEHIAQYVGQTVTVEGWLYDKIDSRRKSIEPEIAYCDLDQLLEIGEQFVSHIVPPFPRIRYDDAVERLHQLEAEAADEEQKGLLKITCDDDIGSPHKTALTQQFNKPVFVVDYPTASS